MVEEEKAPKAPKVPKAPKTPKVKAPKEEKAKQERSMLEPPAKPAFDPVAEQMALHAEIRKNTPVAEKPQQEPEPEKATGPAVAKAPAAIASAPKKAEPAKKSKGVSAISNGVVYPSTETTIAVEEDVDYGGAHKYSIKNCTGFKDGKTEYVNSEQTIQFIQKNEDGSIIPGVQSEQLILMLIDRHKKLNRKFPSEQFHKMLQGLNLFLTASQERVDERVSRGVMGDLKK